MSIRTLMKGYKEKHTENQYKIIRNVAIYMFSILVSIVILFTLVVLMIFKIISANFDGIGLTILIFELQVMSFIFIIFFCEGLTKKESKIRHFMLKLAYNYGKKRWTVEEA